MRWKVTQTNVFGPVRSVLCMCSVAVQCFIYIAHRTPSRLRISELTQNFWVFSFYIAEFWHTFWVIWENGSNWSNLRLKMSFFALGRLKNHKVPHLHPNSTMFMPLDRLQLKIYAFSGKFNVCSKCVLLSWIKICRDFTLQTQDFYSEIKELTQILLRISEEKIGSWGLWCEQGWALYCVVLWAKKIKQVWN